jgi:surface-anchored protein
LNLTTSVRAAASVAAAVVLAATAPVTVAAQGAAASAPLEQLLDAERVDVAAISVDGTAIGLRADDVHGQPHDPASLVYTTEASQDGVEVGWDTSDVDAGMVFGDAVTLRMRAVDGPVDVQAEPLRLPAGERGATTWTFPAPGRYTLAVTVEGHLLTGEPVITEEQYTVAVREGAPESPETTVPDASQEESPESPSAQRVAEPLPAAPLAAQAQPAPTTPGRVVLTEGHVDAVAPRVLDGKLQIQVKDGTTVGRSGGQVRWREPRDVVFQAKASTKTTLPDDPALAFLGKKGDEIYLLPQQQQTGILWTGWSTEELHAGQVSGQVTWRLTKVDGPGPFGIFTTGSFGDSTVIFDSTDGLPDTHAVPLGTHAHANWGFAKRGTYRLTFEVTAKLAGGQTVTDTEVYTFAVDSAAPGGGSPGGDGSGGGGNGGNDGGSGGGDGGLAYTGVTGVLPLAAGGVALLVLGGGVLVVGRRRKAGDR